MTDRLTERGGAGGTTGQPQTSSAAVRPLSTRSQVGLSSSNMRFAAVPVACGPSRGGWFSPAGQIVGRAPEIAGLCRRPVTGRVEVAVSARAIAARPHAAASRALPACFRPPSLPWRGRPSYQACQMKLRRFLLRYYPPGIILEYEQGGELRNKPVDLLTLTPESDLEVLVNQVVRQEALISENRKPQLRKLMWAACPCQRCQRC